MYNIYKNDAHLPHIFHIVTFKSSSPLTHPKFTLLHRKVSFIIRNILSLLYHFHIFRS